MVRLEFAAPNTECMIVDLETGEPLGPNQKGEVCVRGPQVMMGYLNKPDATEQTIDADGWLHTGDIGYADEDGHFFIVDRAKELIKYKGFQVPPAELEAVLLTHPCIADAAVIPYPDDEAGEVPKGILVLREQVEPEAILEYVAERVAPHKRIRYLEFVDKIPKSPSGKILRRVLVEAEKAEARFGLISRKDEKMQRVVLHFASLRLCVRNPYHRSPANKLISRPQTR